MAEADGAFVSANHTAIDMLWVAIEIPRQRRIMAQPSKAMRR